MKYRYNQSLFVRLQKDRPDAVHLLRWEGNGLMCRTGD